MKKETNSPANKIKDKPLSNFAITISREYGSGGKYIGEQLAKRFKIKCYDNEILKKIAKEAKINISSTDLLDEDSFLYEYVSANAQEKSSAADKLFMAQSKVIEDLYKKGSCVIIGRCAESVLESFPNVFSIFIYASDNAYKIKRKMKYEGLSREEAEEKIAKTDKKREKYYNKYTGKAWGDKGNYALSFDTSKYGIQETINAIEEYIRLRLNQ